MNKELVLQRTLADGTRVVLVHRPDYNSSFFLYGTRAGGLDLTQNVDGEVITYRSGCAHFLEHQMFRLNGRDCTEDFALNGASVNAYTGLQETAYFFSTAHDPLPSLNLLMDMVQTWDIDEQSIEKEKPIILSEYDYYAQNPESVLMREVWNSLYYHHPIRRDILGTREDIEQMQVKDLFDFYRNNYHPSQTILVGVTGRDLNEVMKGIKPRRVKKPLSVQRRIPGEPASVCRPDYRFSFETSEPYACIAVKMDPYATPEENEWADTALQMTLDACFSALAEEYQDWLDQRILTSYTSAECDITMDYAHVVFSARTGKPFEFREIVEQTVKKMQEKPIEEQLFNALKHRQIAQWMRLPDQLESLTMELYQSLRADTDFFKRIDTLKSMTPETVFETVRKMDLSRRAFVLMEPNKNK